MSELQVVSNYHERNFLYSYDIPDSVLAYYDWLSNEEKSDNWMKYKNEYYHISDFMRYDDEYWNGIVSDTYSSGIFIRISDDCETYQIAYYYC